MQKPAININLNGPDGNAFTIMGAVSKALRKAGRENEITQYLTEAKSGDYDNLLEVSMRYVDFSSPDSSEVVSAMTDMEDPDNRELP